MLSCTLDARSLAPSACILFACAATACVQSNGTKERADRLTAPSTPSPEHSYAPEIVVGNASGAVIGEGTRIEVRNADGAPLPHALVELDFGAAPGITLFDTQTEATAVDCAARTISARTDADGVVSIAPRFGGATAEREVVVRAEGLVLGTAAARSTDLDGDGQTGLADLAAFSEAFFAGDVARADFDADGDVSLADHLIYAAEHFSTARATPCGTSPEGWTTVARLAARTEGEFSGTYAIGRPCIHADVLWVDPAFWREGVDALDAGVCYNGGPLPEVRPGVYRADGRGELFVWRRDRHSDGSLVPPPPLEACLLCDTTATLEYDVWSRNVATFNVFEGTDDVTGRRFRLVQRSGAHVCSQSIWTNDTYNFARVDLQVLN
jgi:hypothetical protein